jgi:hypothetical protein
MRLKRPVESKSERIDLRITKDQKNKIRQKAALYCEGNVAQYVLYASLHFVPGKEDFEEETKTPARKPGKIKR